MELITVFSAFNIVEADLVRSRLEVAEFHPVVTHGLSALSMDGYSLATGGVLVQVPDSEAEEVRAFLASPDAPPTP
jgi:hypothetical protein